MEKLISKTVTLILLPLAAFLFQPPHVVSSPSCQGPQETAVGPECPEKLSSVDRGLEYHTRQCDNT